ncbi:ATP-binding cassette domain-containing protein [Reichenbachiella agariperforans]|uniref:ATP-binding cassette domain-containing protein n=1 Tax=Reichenbachiella agariperforans TaxID=156994 RepID=UPI001C087550|nr:ATP-binding cassette domain-containing protein [Reichenbachiella agariperforans]MBU2912553.1 ATP-binding cassette domain-containing protein [Reichenbachiella agariperforans]
MSESIINALMRLFAIIESVKDEVVDSGHMIVKPYLQRQLNQELSDQYLELFQDYVDFYRKEASSNTPEIENETKNIIQVTKICQQLNKELLQHERVLVFVELVELINTDKKVSTRENDFMQLVALNFNLPKQETDDICSFILDQDIKNVHKGNGMVIDNKVTEWPKEIAWMMKRKTEPGITDFRHIQVENLFGTIVILHVESINTFIFRYNGPLSLFVEGKKIQNGKIYILNSGAIIKGSTIKPIYESDISKRFLLDVKKTKLVLQAEEMTYNFKNSDNGIKPFSFSEESGQLIGVMGGSGTGKSTLMNLLNGKLEPKSGEIKINGYSIPRSVQEGVIGYVPQDDLLFDELTVYENLYFNAKLCFGDLPENRIRREVNKVLEDLDIEEIKDLKVGDPLNKSISGGQRKRLNIALELLREPSVLYIDEPTSGLSSMDSEKVVNLLKEQTRNGKLVIIIIHQPSSAIYKLFDKVWILDKGGYPVYTGNPIDAIVYFKTMNTEVNAAESECRTCGNVIPEQILHIIETKEIDEKGGSTKHRKTSPEEWYEKYKENIESKTEKIKFETALPPSNFSIPNLIQQSTIYLKRVLLSKRSNTQYILLNILEPPLLALILGFLAKYSESSVYDFSENRNIPIYLFMTIVVSLFTGLTVSAEEIFKDKKILERESFLNLSRFSYLNSKIIYLFGLSAVQVLIFTLFGNYLLEIKGLTFQYWLILFSTACFANMVGLNISSGFNSIVTIYILIPLILVPQLLLGGAMIRFDDLNHGVGDKKNVPFIGDMMVSRWAYEALAVEQASNNAYRSHFMAYDKRMSDASYTFAYLIPDLSGKLREAYMEVLEDNHSQKAIYNLKMCRHEIEKLQNEEGNPRFAAMDQLYFENLDSALYEQSLAYLRGLRKKYKNIKQQAVNERDSIYRQLIKEIGQDGLLELKRTHHNDALHSLVLNRDQIQKIYEGEDELIRKKDPLFITPDSKWGNAPFYAHVKVLGNWEIDTFYFNLAVIWIMTFITYLMLYFDLLRKVLKWSSRQFEKR